MESTWDIAMDGLKKEDIDEIIECMSVGHEVVFSWKHKEYIMQPEIVNRQIDLVFYESEPEFRYLLRIPIPEEIYKKTYAGIRMFVGEEIVQQMLNVKCLEGHSFMEESSQIEIISIF